MDRAAEVMRRHLIGMVLSRKTGMEFLAAGVKFALAVLAVATNDLPPEVKAAWALVRSHIVEPPAEVQPPAPVSP